MSEHLLELRLLELAYTKSQHKRVLLKNLHLTLDAGQRIGLFAPNGSGKTTLLRSIVGFMPYTGELLFQGQRIETASDFSHLRRHVGLVLQDSTEQIFFPEVLEDVCFGPINLGLTLKESEERAFSVLKELGIEKLAHQSTFHLSGGEKRLVALAGILAMQPQILLLDEPTTGLDQESLERLLAILENLPQACIIVTHDIFFMQKVADTFYTIQKEQLIKMEQPVVHRHKHAHFGGNLAHEHANFQ
ncbi:MAG: ABC transporter ATP-binding protein [Desulfovibrio sp.]|nr:ABC transporter ATP-binding protein [Desulfovibrio sp.]